MAISLSAGTVYSLKADPVASSHASQLLHLSSLQFRTQLRRFGIRNHVIKFRRQPTTLPLVVEAKQRTFSTFDDLLENSDKPVLIDFYATWCGPCQFMVPILKEVGTTLRDKIQVVKIDTEKYPSIADKYRIEALPTFILFKDGKPHDRFEGALSADQLIERIEASLKVEQ